MPYTLRKTNGSTLAIIQDGAIETSTDLVFVGKNYAGYGQTVNENFLKLLENFSSSRIPANPLTGQVWFDTSTLKLKVYDGIRFKSLTITEIDNKRPSDLRQGDQWFDPVDQALYVYNGQDFIKIGPEKSAKALQSQIAGVLVPGNDNNSYTVLQASIDTGTGSVVAAFSKSSFEPESNSEYYTQQKFLNIQRGISLPGYTAVRGTFDQTIIGAVPDLTNQWTFFGAASSAWGMLEKDNSGSTVAFYDAKEYIRRSIGDSLRLNGELVTSSNDGVTVGTGKIIKLHVVPAYGNTAGNLTNLQSTRINFNIQTVNTNTNVIALDYSAGTLLVLPNAPLGSTNSPTHPVDIGTETQRFRSVYAKNIYANVLSTSTTGLIQGTWSLAPGSSIIGGSVQATTAITATNAVNLQSFDNVSYVHAQTATNALSITQRDADGRVWANGIVASPSASFFGSWTVGSGASVQATTILGSDNVGYIGASASGSNNTIVQRTGTGGVNATSVTTQAISAGSLTSSNGTISGQWTLVGSSTLEATYADLAERYASDKEYTPGTVLIIGGSKEVTTTSVRADVKVAGIVSTSPAFKMNYAAGENSTHPYIALKGRVPCKVRGKINKGNRLVTSALPGYAEAFQAGDDPNAVIGIALEDWFGDQGVIEVMVK